MRFLLNLFLMLFPFFMIGQPFDKLHSQVGLSHQYSSTSNIGGGVVITDINNDGWMDLYLPGGILLDKVFLNVEGQLFSNISSSAGMLQTGWANTQGGISADFNNDGFEDLFITTQKALNKFGSPTINTRNFLMLNNGDNTYTEVGSIYGIVDSSYSVSATSGDFNQDGILDIYVANYVKVVSSTTDPETGQVDGFNHQCFENYFYTGSESGIYTELAQLFGMDDAGCSLAAIATDYNWDGYTDIMSVNDFGQWVLPNSLFQNQGGNFNNLAQESNADVGIYAMGVSGGDFNEDGLMDYYLTNLGRNVLLQQLPNNTFIDVTTQLGLENEFVNGLLTTSWSSFFFDYDNDSYLDLFVSNGQMPAAGFIATGLYDPNKLYRNLGDGTFEDVSEQMGVADTAVGRGAAYLDFNNDGRLDFVQVNIQSSFNNAFNQPVLYLNHQENDNNWVMFSLKGVTINRSAVGTRMELYAGGRKFIREVDGGSGFASHNDKRLHFGLGQIAAIDSIAIYWTGIETPQMFYNLAINQIHTILQQDVATSVHENTFAPVLKVFPNPVQEVLCLDVLRVSSERINLTWFDLNGKELAEFSINSGFEGVFYINMSEIKLAPGMYLLHVSSEFGSEYYTIAVTP